MQIRALLGGLIGVAALLAGGCAGSSSSANSGAASSAPASAPTTATPKPPAPGSQAELDAYLKKVLRPRLKGNAAIDRNNKALQNVDSTTDSTWDRAALSSRHTAQDMRRFSDRISAIVPPRPLTRAHLAYAQGWRADGLIYTDLAAVLRQHGFLNWDTFNARFRGQQHSVTAYRVALIAYAAKHGLKLPHWVHTIGGR